MILLCSKVGTQLFFLPLLRNLLSFACWYPHDYKPIMLNEVTGGPVPVAKIESLESH